ncbi:MAG: methyl-accepting chemotaxis protein [Woeseiaceae bacterium]|nr:methyl-accepting chemotaxis protein [Woeseiaceae bacterium]
MADKTNTSTAFRIVALVIALALIAAGGLVFLQSGASPSTALAAISQALPKQANDALMGEGGGFPALADSVSQLDELGGVGAGSTADWRELSTRAESILGRRTDIEALNTASAGITATSAEILGLSDQLMNRTSSTAVVQELQQRSNRLATATSGLALSEDAGQAAEAIATDVAFLREVANALNGESSSLDVRALNAAGRDTVGAPLAAYVAELESQSEALSASAMQMAGLRDQLAGLESASANLRNSAISGGQSSLPAFLTLPWLPIGLMGLGVILVLVLIALNSRSSTFERTAKEQAEQNERNQQAILRLLDEMGSLADGDLTVEATVTEDITGTIADSFNYAIEELRKLVTTVNETAIMVDSAAKQTESTASHMARAADNQTKEINAATESIVSMAGSIEEVSGNAERSSDVARHSVEVAHKGGEAVRRTIDGMNTIRETIQETSKRIKRLGESSQEIGNIVELINDIAEQTNILALNASIQASMAGEAGRGFAVVADEVQRLAERSTNATKQIEVLVSTIQADTKEAVVSMERSTTDVVGGALLAENAGAALDEIEQVSNQIANLVQNISVSARQQARSAADVTRRTTRLGEISTQTGKATTATAAAISKLSEFASQLRMSVAGFTLPQDQLPQSNLQAAAADDAAVESQRQVSAG